MKHLLFILVLFAGCVTEHNDIYKIIPKGAPLTKDILVKAHHIIPDDSVLVIGCAVSTYPDDSAYHLLFYKNLKLLSAAYFPYGPLESIKNKTIRTYKDEYSNSSTFFTNDLPPGYRFLFDPIMGGNHDNWCNRIIDKIIVDSSLNLTICTRMTDDIYGGYNVLTYGGLDTTSPDLALFIKKDTVVFNVGELKFYCFEDIIMSWKMTGTDHFIFNKMIVGNKRVADDFYDQLWRVVEHYKQ